jgi:hypothetical protein
MHVKEIARILLTVNSHTSKHRLKENIEDVLLLGAYVTNKKFRALTYDIKLRLKHIETTEHPLQEKFIKDATYDLFRLHTLCRELINLKDSATKLSNDDVLSWLGHAEHRLEVVQEHYIKTKMIKEDTFYELISTLLVLSLTCTGVVQNQLQDILDFRRIKELKFSTDNLPQLHVLLRYLKHKASDEQVDLEEWLKEKKREESEVVRKMLEEVEVLTPEHTVSDMVLRERVISMAKSFVSDLERGHDLKKSVDIFSKGLAVLQESHTILLVATPQEEGSL